MSKHHAATAVGGLQRLNRLALALAPAACLWLAGPAALADVTVTGPYSLDPNTGAILGPGNVSIPGSTLALGAGSNFAVTAGASAALAAFSTNGSVTLSDLGSLLSLRSGVAGDASTSNPRVNIGIEGNGSMTVRGGAALRIEGLAPASPVWFGEGAGLITGSGWGTASSGRIEVSGAGSRVDTLGTNNFITIATGPKASGQMSLSNGAVAHTTLMGIGDWGASGSVQVDNATLRLSGAWRDGAVIGASLAVGNGPGSTGTISLKNGARVFVENSGTELTNLSLGGLAFNPGGTGVLDASGGSSVSVSSAGASQFIVGMTSGGVGVASFSGGSSLTAGYVGVGAQGGHDTGGSGTLIINDSSTLTATTLEVGAKGYVGGTGTINANVVNRGVFSPGNSPGTLTVNGSFSAAAGAKLVLEVQSDGHGGFVTDHLIFGSGQSVNLSGLGIEFRFLGSTDPNAFQASGEFKIDQFLSQSGSPLDHSLLAGASYTASSDSYSFTGFNFNADGGAVFQAQAVPEPGTWALFAAGLSFGGCLLRRRGTGR